MDSAYSVPVNKILNGTPASRGIAFGRITFLHRETEPLKKHSVDDPSLECLRFEKAREKAILQLGSLYDTSLEKLGEQNAFVFQIHQLMLDDPDYVSQIKETINAEKVNAEYAVDLVASRFAAMFKSMDNEYMQGRASDVIDVSRRLNDILLYDKGGDRRPRIHKIDGQRVILATDDLAPSETVQLDQDAVSGIITSKGSTRSHTVIFARTMGLPAVITIGDELNEELEGKFVIVDGAQGIVILEPDANTIALYSEKKRTEDALRQRLELYRGRETFTRNGRKINLYANASSLADIDLIKASDAEGIGLFRSEYIYLSSDNFPTEDYQYEIYRNVLSEMDGRRVVIRTLDIGADKTADYFMLKKEDNPAMGMRAVRICLTQPEIFKTQLRALYRASVHGHLAIMFPMINSVEEVKGCLKICHEVECQLASENIDFDRNIEKGIMIETPAAAIISDEIAPLVDFFSIGTNDLTQFTLAVDRQNASIGRFLNPYHHAVMRLIETTVINAHKAGIWVGICGELASDENFTHELVRIGIDEISVVPSNILMLRARIATIG